MIKSHIITIDEMDEPLDAVETLKQKLETLQLKSNSFGIISAHPDTIDSGVYGAVCTALPFDVAGVVCDIQAAGGVTGTFLLSIMILTSDDCDFACASVDNIYKLEDVGRSVKECYRNLSQSLSSSPKLALMYTPFNVSRLPSEFIQAVSEENPALPIFGSVAQGKNTFDNVNVSFVLCNGTVSEESVAMVLISGDFTPEFLISSFVAEAVVMKDIGVVTKAENNHLMEINDMNATEFLRKIGFIDTYHYGDLNAGLMTTALALESSGDDEPKHSVYRAVFSLTEDGATCLGRVEEGEKISIAVNNPDSVMQTAKEMVAKIKESGCQTALLYSCIGRKLGLFNAPMDEMNEISAGLSGINYTAVYAAGEICPTCNASNHEHNQTLIACIF